MDVPRSADLGARAKLFTIKAPCHICLTFRIGVIWCPAAECQVERCRVQAGRARQSEALPKVWRNMKSNRLQQMWSFQRAPGHSSEMSRLSVSKCTKCCFIKPPGANAPHQLIKFPFSLKWKTTCLCIFRGFLLILKKGRNLFSSTTGNSVVSVVPPRMTIGGGPTSVLFWTRSVLANPKQLGDGCWLV